MAVANTKSSTISSLDGRPSASINSFKHAGRLRISKDSAEVLAVDDDNSVYRMVRLPSSASIKELNILNDTITDGTDYDLGVYETPVNGGGVVDANLFSSTISMVGARTLPLNAIFEAGLDITQLDKRLWELLGLSEDPFRNYDICFTANTVGSVDGTLALESVWSQ